MDTPGGGEPSTARDRLWERLLAGELTRVAVSCDIESTEVFKHFIPHSLGLERIWPQAHEQDRRTGAWRSGAELGRIAQELSAQDGWICGSGRPNWDARFMKQAEAILIFQTPAGRRSKRIATFGASASAVARVVLRRRSSGGDGITMGGRGSRPGRAFYSRTGHHALENYPDKTFIIDQRKYLKPLRAI